jgi:hypothetical protein
MPDPTGISEPFSAGPWLERTAALNSLNAAAGMAK